MYGVQEIEVSRLHREEIGREVRLNRVSGTRRTGGDFGVMRELRRDLGRLLNLFRVARNAG